MYDFLIGFDTYIHYSVKNKQNFDLFSFKESGLKRVQWIKKLAITPVQCFYSIFEILKKSK